MAAYLRPKQNAYHFLDDISILLTENVWILNEYTLKCILKGLTDDKSMLVQVMN